MKIKVGGQWKEALLYSVKTVHLKGTILGEVGNLKPLTYVRSGWVPLTFVSDHGRCHWSELAFVAL